MNDHAKTGAPDYLSLSRMLAAGLPVDVLAASRAHVTLSRDSDPAWPEVWTTEDFVAYVEDPHQFDGGTDNDK